MPKLLYVVMAYFDSGTMPDGSTTFVKEFYEGDNKLLKTSCKPGQFALPREIAYRANLIVRVEVQTGISTILKNRWGPNWTKKAPEEAQGFPVDNLRFVPLPPAPPSKNVLIDNLLPVEAKMKAKAYPDPTPPLFHPVEHVEHVPCQGVERVDVPSAAPAICRCDMKDLLSTGHVAGCPEKKK